MKKLSPLIISIALHAAAIVVVLVLSTRLYNAGSEVVDFVFYQGPTLKGDPHGSKAPVKQVVQQKPQAADEKATSSLSSSESQSSAEQAQKGSVFGGSEGLPVPTSDSLVTQEPSIVFEPKKKERTEEARRNGYTGKARMRVLIDQEGNVREVTLLNELKYGLDLRAIELAKQTKFKPAMMNSNPVTVLREFTVTFKATD